MNESEMFLTLATQYAQFESSLKPISTLNLFHYTSPEGLLGILDNPDGIHLHFTRMDCLNDLSESKLLAQHYTEACNELLKKGDIDQKYFDEIFNLSAQETMPFVYYASHEDIPTLTPVKYTPYVCCFSSDPDSLPMWRYYSKNNRGQGYCIKFCSHVFEDFFKGTLKMRVKEIELHKVKYATADNKSIISKMILDFQPYIFLTSEATSRVKNIIRSCLTKLKLQYKSHYFEPEKEIRAILYVPQEVPVKADNYTPHTIKYKTKEGLIIPYVDVILKNKAWLTGTTIGPFIEPNSAKELLYSFLRDKGYNRCGPEDIQTSQVPIRY